MKTRFYVSFALLALASVSFAGSTSVTTEAALLANDFIDWGQFGADFTIVNSGTHGFTNNGIGFTVYSVNDNTSVDDGGQYQLLTEGSTWNGGFNPGDHVLFKTGSFAVNSTDLEIVFDQKIGGIGSGFQSNAFGDFTGSMGAWDNNPYFIANNVGFSSNFGNNHGGSDGTAPFMGVLSDQTDILAAYLEVQMADFSDSLGSGWSHTLVRDTGAVPEPASMAVLGLGAIALIRRRRQSK